MIANLIKQRGLLQPISEPTSAAVPSQSTPSCSVRVSQSLTRATHLGCLISGRVARSPPSGDLSRVSTWSREREKRRRYDIYDYHFSIYCIVLPRSFKFSFWRPRLLASPRRVGSAVAAGGRLTWALASNGVGAPSLTATHNFPFPAHPHIPISSSHSMSWFSTTAPV